MSWHINNTGSKEAVTAAIDEALETQGGMPADVGAYLKIAVTAITLNPGFLVHVESSGHRPTDGAGSNESLKVEVIKTGPWKWK